MKVPLLVLLQITRALISCKFKYKFYNFIFVTSQILSHRKLATTNIQQGDSFYHETRYQEAIICYMEAIKLTLDSGDASAIQLIGSLYEKLAYGSLRIGDINRAFIAGKMVVKLNDNNIVGWLCVAHCASILKTRSDFIYYSHNVVRIIYSNLKKIFNDIKLGVDSMDFEKVIRITCMCVFFLNNSVRIL